MTNEAFQALLARGPVLLDGATGSNLMRAGMPRGICTEVWVTEHPEPLLALQRDYIAAGSQIIYAPTFCANRRGLARCGPRERCCASEPGSSLPCRARRQAATRSWQATSQRPACRSSLPGQ